MMILRSLSIGVLCAMLLPSLALAAAMKQLDIADGIHHSYFTDGRGVFYKMGEGKRGAEYRKLPGAKSVAFRIAPNQQIAGPYVQDDRFVYYYYRKIPRADARTFEVMGGGYARDHRSIFHGARRLRVVYDDFKVLGDLYATDGRRVFFEGALLAGADAETFVLTGDFCAKDAKNSYCWGSVSRKADPQSFESLGVGITKDAKRVYCAGDTYTTFDAPTFSVVNSSYAKDRKTAYWMMVTPSGCTFTKISGADPATFAAVEKNGTMYLNYAVDAQHVYFNGSILQGADPKTFDPEERS